MDPETNSAETSPEIPPAADSTAVTPPEPPPAKRTRKTEEPQKPSLGRVVHYVLPDGNNAGDHRPAIIVRVWPDTVNLQVFYDGDGTPHMNDGQLNTLWKLSVPFSAEPKPGTYHWPERE